jgi:putative peptidoglycan lipid II flippase
MYKPAAGWLLFMAKLLLALLAMAAALYFAAGTQADWLDYTAASKLTHLLGLVLLGAGVYFACLWLTGFRLRDYMRRAQL